MKITFLGTGTSQGIPVIACKCRVCNSSDARDNRLRSSVLIEDENHKIVIDTGPDFRQQMLRANVLTLDAVLFTHEHKDHVAGLDDIRSYNYLQNKPMDIYTEKRVLRALKREFPYIFRNRNYPGVPEVKLHKIRSGKLFEIADFSIMPIRVMHAHLPILGYRIHDFTYITDAKYIDNENMNLIKGTRILVINALREKEHFSHFNLSEALRTIKIINPEKAFLTHLSHKFDTHKNLSKLIPENVEIAYDGLEIIV